MKETNMQFPPVSVVIPTWNAGAFVERVLQALLQQNDVPLEIIVLDNGVVNNETELVAERISTQNPAVKYFSYKEQLGYAGAVNAGVKHASHSLIAVCNNDNLPDPNWLKELVLLHLKRNWHGKVIAITTSFVPRSGPYSHHRTDYNFCGRVLYRDQEKIPEENFSVFHPDGSSFLFDKALLGLPYNEEYFIYHEDSAIGWRARLMGYEVVLAKKSYAETFDGGSTRRIPYRTAYYSERNRWLNALCFPQVSTILRLLPVWAFDLALSFGFGQRRWARINAWYWLLTNPSFLCAYRKEMQALRKVSDREILPFMTAQYLEFHGNGLGSSLKQALNFCFKIYFKIICLPMRN